MFLKSLEFRLKCSMQSKDETFNLSDTLKDCGESKTKPVFWSVRVKFYWPNEVYHFFPTNDPIVLMRFLFIDFPNCRKERTNLFSEVGSVKMVIILTYSREYFCEKLLSLSSSNVAVKNINRL